MDYWYFRYNEQINYTETLNQIVGSSSDISATDITAHADGTSIYVDWTGNDSTGTGTQASPFRTIHHAISNMGGKSIITIMDSNEYYSGKAGTLTLALAGLTLQGIEGESPTITIDETVASQTDMVTLTAGGTIQNVNLTIPSTYTSSQVTGILCNSGNGTIKYVTISGATDEGIEMLSGCSTITLSNTIIKNGLNRGTSDGNGILIEDGTLNATRLLAYNNSRAGIYANGSTAKTVNLDYCTIANNYYGLHGTDSSNTTITVDDSILYLNTLYDYSYNGGALNNNCIGLVNGNPTLTGVYVRYNPLFVSDTDYRLRTYHNEYAVGDFISPCLGVSGTNSDLGCYDYTRSSGTPTYTEFSVLRNSDDNYNRRVKKIDAKLYRLLSAKSKIYSKGITYVTEIAFDTLEDTDFANIKTMYEAGGEMYFSNDNGVTYTEYLIDDTRDLQYNRPSPPKVDMDIYKNVSLALIEVS